MKAPRPLAWGMWKRFLVAAVLIAGLAGGATATIALNEVESVGSESSNPETRSK